MLSGSRVHVVTEPAQRAHIPANTDFTVSESSGSQLLLSLLRDSGKPRGSETAA